MNIKLKKLSTKLKIPDLIVNLIASAIFEIAKNKINKFNFSQFKRNEKKWLKKFCIENDGTILVSGYFEKFIKYHNPFEDIISFVVNSEFSVLTEREFINDIIKKFKSTIPPEKTLNVADEKLVDELVSNLLSHIKQYLKKELTQAELYYIFLQKQEMNKLTNLIKEQGEDISEALGVIASCSKISDDKVEEFYRVINKILLQGHIEIVYKLIPLIENKNDDLEYGVKILLQIISDYHILPYDILSYYLKIKNGNIKIDICRILIIYFMNDSVSLEKIKNTTNNDDLNSIIEKLINHDCFYVEKTEEKNYVTFYNISISKEFKNEQELVNHLCFFDIYQKRLSEVSGVLELVKPDECFIDKLFELESKHLNFLRNFDGNNKDDITLFCDELLNMENLYVHATQKVKNKYYEILLMTMHVSENQKIYELISTLPNEVKVDFGVSLVIMKSRIKNDTVTEKEILDFCYKTKHYILINDYICEKGLDTKKIKELLDNNISFVKNEFLLFIIYAQVVMRLEGNSSVQQLKQDYSNDYGQYLEYYLVTLDSENTEKYEIDLNNAFTLWTNKKVRCYHIDSEVEFIRILINNKKYSEACEVLKKQEEIKCTNHMLPKYKAKLLLEQQKFLDALSILVDNFELYKDDPETIDNIICISLKNAREINPIIVGRALDFRTPRLLLLVSYVYVQEGKYNEAKQLMKEALIKSPDATDMCEGYLDIHTQSPSKEHEVIKFADIDTAIILENDDSSLVYCIHKNKFLETEPYVWENSVHISEDTAVRMNLLNKKVDSEVLIDNTNYSIREIVSMEAFLTRCCMDTMVKKGTAKAFHAKIKDNNFVNIDEFINWLKENTGDDGVVSELMEKYKDLSQMPIPVFIIQKVARPSFTELIGIFLEDKTIIFRDSIFDGTPTENGYILTTSAVIALYKIGVDINLLNNSNVFIPESMNKHIHKDIEECIRHNKSEHNTTMDVVNDKLVVHELSDDEKQSNLLDAINLRTFVDGIQIKKNNSNVLIEETGEVSYHEVLGISDYDSFSIAISEKDKLVSGESSLLGLARCYNINASCILDFLCEINTPLLDLIKYMKKMLGFKFVVILSNFCMEYLTQNFYNLASDEQLLFLEEWDEFLNSIQEHDEKYKEICVSLLNEVFRVQYKNKETFLNNPVLKITMPHILSLNNIRVELQIMEDGEVGAKIYKPYNTNDQVS